MRSFRLAFAKSSALWNPASIRAFARVFPIPLIPTRSSKMSGWAVFAASSSRIRRWMPSSPGLLWSASVYARKASSSRPIFTSTSPCAAHASSSFG